MAAGRDLRHNEEARLARLQEIPWSEEKKLSGITQGARQTIEFYKKLGQSISNPNLTQIAELWRGPECQFAASLVGRRFRAVGSFEQPLGGLGLFSAIATGLASPPLDHVTIEYEGTVTGHAISGGVSRRRASAMPSTLLSAADEHKPFNMVLTESGTEMRGIEGEGNNRRFFTWNLELEISTPPES